MLTRLLPWLYARLNVGRWLRNPLLERMYLALLFAYKRYAEDPFAALALRRPDLFREGHILDVGANVGYTASIFAAAAGEGYRVYAFEPEPVNLRRLRRVLRAKQLDERVVVVESAVGDRDGDAGLFVNELHPGDHRVTPGESGATLRVPITTLDSFVARNHIHPVRFVKIDVQGLELAVSRGMESLLRANPRLAVAFEYHEPSARTWGYSAADLTGFYSARTFDLFVLNHRGELIAASPEEIAREHDQRGYVDLLAIREGSR